MTVQQHTEYTYTCHDARGTRSTLQRHIRLHMRVQLGKFWTSLILQHRPFQDPLVKNRVSRRAKPHGSIRWSIRSQFGSIRVNSEYIRFCSTATAVENHMKTEGFWEGQFQTPVNSPQQPHLFIIIKGRHGARAGEDNPWSWL